MLPAISTIEHDLVQGIYALRKACLTTPRPDADGLLAALAQQTGSTAILMPAGGPVPEVREGGDQVLAVSVETPDRRLGALVVTRNGEAFSDMERILVEHAAALLAVVLVDEARHEQVSDDRERNAARLAVQSLSEAERRGVQILLEGYQGAPMTVRLKDAAEKAGIHHSALVQALSKLRAGGVLVASSRGRRGVQVTILNSKLLAELQEPVWRR